MLADGTGGHLHVPLGDRERRSLSDGGSECRACGGARRPPSWHRLHSHLASQHAGTVRKRRELRHRKSKGTLHDFS